MIRRRALRPVRAVLGGLPSLDGRLARRVLVPLAIVWLAGSVAAAAVGSYFAAAVFDRALMDDALGLAASVTQEHDGSLRVDLTVDELRAVLFDQSESVFFAVRRMDGSLVAGDARLQVERHQPGQPYEFADLSLDDEDLRAVALVRHSPQPFTLVLAQTTRYRGALLRRMLLYSTAPQVLLLIALGVWLRRAIQVDVQPIAALQSELNRRDAADLRPLHVPASTHDVDRLVHSVDALMQRLSAALRSQREFSGNVAHELRTPLAGIRALAEYGLASSDPARWREQLQGIAQSEARASRLVDQLLAIALADESPGAIVLQPVALDEVVRRVLVAAMPRADAAGVDLGAQGVDDTVRVQGDAALLEGALQNLLDNALRYGRPADGSVPQVTVALHDDAGRVLLSVVDNGPGMAAADPARLLARWQQGGAGRRLGEGAGLGLAIVSRYAQLLGAALSVGPGPQGQGTCVQLAFAADASPAHTIAVSPIDDPSTP
ncbi:sensor histidine kinase [Aquincola sp. MAHUQ-54]|uniref:histidine kinase n=1 Tax=Aquincola agrisoli TaxID=3119538 RepID=A0AAW9Q3J1_9BURK